MFDDLSAKESRNCWLQVIWRFAWVLFALTVGLSLIFACYAGATTLIARIADAGNPEKLARDMAEIEKRYVVILVIWGIALYGTILETIRYARELDGDGTPVGGMPSTEEGQGAIEFYAEIVIDKLIN